MTRVSKLPTDLEPIAVALEASRRQHGFDALVHSESVSVLRTIFPFNAALSLAERPTVVRKAIARSAAEGPLTRQSLERSLRREERAVLDTPLSRFVLASNLSFSRAGDTKAAQFATGIRLTRRLPERFLAGRSHPHSHVPHDDRLVRDYVGVLTRVRARSREHAFELAISRLDLLRGIWNFAHASRTIWESTADPTAPISRIRYSRVHTLHRPDGTLASEIYWFNPDFRQQKFPHLSDADWAGMQRFLRSAQQRLPRIKYRNDLERAFVHYGRALDSTDMESAFLKLWSVLEMISGVGGERYDTLIARAAFLFDSDRFTKYVLEHLRFQRNEIVHLGTPQAEIRPLVYQLKSFVDQMINVHLAMGRHFESLEEAGHFMDLSQDPATLRRRISVIQHALRFRQQ